MLKESIFKGGWKIKSVVVCMYHLRRGKGTGKGGQR
jgi:hypothetical protein